MQSFLIIDPLYAISISPPFRVTLTLIRVGAGGDEGTPRERARSRRSSRLSLTRKGDQLLPRTRALQEAAKAEAAQAAEGGAAALAARLAHIRPCGRAMTL